MSDKEIDDAVEDEFGPDMKRILIDPWTDAVNLGNNRRILCYENGIGQRILVAVGKKLAAFYTFHKNLGEK